MKRFGPFVGLVFLLLACLSTLPAQDTIEHDVDDRPRDIGFEERTESRQVQIDLSVSGPESTLARLAAADFEIDVGGLAIDEFTVDALCPHDDRGTPATPDYPEAPSSAPVGLARERVAATSGVTYLLYFDQTHLTSAGRARSIDLAGQLVEKLIRNGHRGMIASNSEQELRTYTGFTSDRLALREALAEFEKDRRQWDSFASFEEQRVRDVMEEFTNGEAHARSRARLYMREELWRSQRALQRFSMVLERFADVPPPKAVLYFADTLRARPGEHYLRLFQANTKDPQRMAKLGAMSSESFAGGTPYQDVIRVAQSHAVRMFTIEGQGLTTASSLTRDIPLPEFKLKSSGGPAKVKRYQADSVLPSSARLRDAQSALSGFALETGGEAFLHGVGAGKIARRVERTFGCIFLVSFDPGTLPLDRSLSLNVRVKQPGVTVTAPTRLTIQSDSARLESRLLAAFVDPGRNDERRTASLQGVVIPTGFVDGEYTTWVQVYVPPSSLPDAEWELGASMVVYGSAKQNVSGRVRPKGGVGPIVLETEMRCRPGPYEIVMVAHEIPTDRIVTGRITGSWPDPGEGPTWISPIAVLQPARAAFLRGGTLRFQGPLGHDEWRSLDAGLPTVITGLFCRGRSPDGEFDLVRHLTGESSVSFPEITVRLDAKECAQIRDVIPARTMTAGGFEYAAEARTGETAVSTTTRRFSVHPPPDLGPSPK